MQTDTVHAYQVEEDDFLVIDGEVAGEVVTITDDGDFLKFLVADDDNDCTEFPFGPFDVVTIVTSFDEDVEFEDVDVD